MRTEPSLAEDPERLTLRQADQARDDFAAIESDLQIIMGQLARLPDRDYASRLAGWSALIFAVALILSL